MRNPNWHRDELILALNLYFKKDLGSIDKKNPKIIELSELLNRLPIFREKPNPDTFRNPNGVTLKLSNFKAIDPTYSGKGMDRGGKLDSVVFFDFVDDKQTLGRIATEIEKLTNYPRIEEVLKFGTDDNDDENPTEGKILFRLHKSRERNKELVNKKKRRVLDAKGKLECEICSFNFELFYGDIGKNFLECHHIIPLSELSFEKKTSLEDLALLCSNCHRMIHKVSPLPRIVDFRDKFFSRSK